MINAYYFNTGIQMDNVKEIKIKNLAYYFFDGIINMKDLDPDNIKIDEKSYKIIVYVLHWVCHTKS